jgi:3-vinyl bacteriochlorophyllide hydratase
MQHAQGGRVMRAQAHSGDGEIPLKSGTFSNSTDSLSGVAGRAVQDWIDRIAPCPWTGHAGVSVRHHHRVQMSDVKPARQALYTPEQRVRRDSSPWTLVQGILAPVQFLVFLASLALVIRYLGTGEGYGAATASIVIKTLVLYAIMVTGAIWEKVVFGKYLFADSFFWEDVFSMLVLALHTAYLGAVLLGVGTAQQQMGLALAAYGAYVINAVQFVWKLRIARLEGAAS